MCNNYSKIISQDQSEQTEDNLEVLEACLDISFGVEELLGGLAHVDAGFLAEHGCVGSQHHHDPLLGGAVHSPRLDKQST